jgi:hypothetical protein
LRIRPHSYTFPYTIILPQFANKDKSFEEKSSPLVENRKIFSKKMIETPNWGLWGRGRNGRNLPDKSRFGGEIGKKVVIS